MIVRRHAHRIGVRTPTKLCLRLSCVLIACGAGERASDDVVAQVGEEFIYERDVEKLMVARGAERGSSASRREHLQTLIDRKLLALEARSRGLDESTAFTRRLAWEVRERAINTYQASTVNARVVVTEEELRQLFQRGRYGSEKLLSRLLVATRQEAIDLRRGLQQNRGRSAEEDRLGYLNRVGAAKAGIAPQVFAALQPGSVSDVLPGDDGFAIIYCAAAREADFARYREELHESVRVERFVAKHLAVVEELADGYFLRPSAAGFAILVARPPGREPRLSRAEARTPLFVYKGGHITVGEYINSFRAAGEQPALGDSLLVSLAAWKLAIPKTLVWESAKAAGHLDSDEMRSWKQRRAEELLIHALRQSEGDRDVDELVVRLRREYSEKTRLL